MPPRTHIKAFRASADGASAVEFALVAVPLLGLCAAILQVGLLIWTTQNFDQSLQRAVRTVLTGQFQRNNAGQSDPAVLLAQLRSRMCGKDSGGIATLYDCEAVKIDVRTSNSFGASTPSKALDPATGTWSRDFGTAYTCARPGAIVTVTAAAKLPTFFGLIGVKLSDFADGSQLLLSTAVFRTEPYQTGTGTLCAS